MGHLSAARTGHLPDACTSGKTYGAPVRSKKQRLSVRTGPPHDAVTVSDTPSPTTSSDADPRIVVRVYGLTDVGHTREHNEDTFLVADLDDGSPVDFNGVSQVMSSDAHGLLFLVADGMGGAASGELASGMAGEVVLNSLRASWLAGGSRTEDAFATALRDATETANSTIHQYAKENPEHRGMGTTATLAGLFGDRLFLAQVGDSRAYLVRGGQARQLTKDQSLMQRLVEAGELTQDEADASDRRNIILQALGPDAHVTVDLTHQQVRRGDTLILCSDGLSGLVRSEEIARFATELPDVETLCHTLVDKANERGGPDNITVIAARFDGDALRVTSETDAHGYTTFPIADESRLVDTIDARVPHATIRSDPTPRYGTPIVPPSALEAEFARARALEEEAALGAPEAVVEDRRRRVQPMMLILLLIAVIASIWILVRWLFADAPKG